MTNSAFTGQYLNINADVIPAVLAARLTVSFYHVTYVFQSESTLYSCLNVKELLARSRHEI